MKMLISATAAVVFSAATAFAQMPGGSMGGMQHEGMGGQQGGMQHGQMMEHGMDHGQMMGSMTDMTGQMYEMMGRMSSFLKHMPPKDMKAMSGLMKDMSQQLMAMSNAMGKGKVSAREMEHLRVRMAEIQRQMSAMGIR